MKMLVLLFMKYRNRRGKWGQSDITCGNMETVPISSNRKRDISVLMGNETLS
jgi:hypothetical protein